LSRRASNRTPEIDREQKEHHAKRNDRRHEEAAGSEAKNFVQHGWLLDRCLSSAKVLSDSRSPKILCLAFIELALLIDGALWMSVR
jgi:hypothetical protein